MASHRTDTKKSKKTRTKSQKDDDKCLAYLLPKPKGIPSKEEVRRVEDNIDAACWYYYYRNEKKYMTPDQRFEADVDAGLIEKELPKYVRNISCEMFIYFSGVQRALRWAQGLGKSGT